MHKIDYHADDYGIFVTTSKQMIELIKIGKLDSISIMANTGCYKECIDLLEKEWSSFKIKPLLSIHLNAVDGLSLINEGRFEYTWMYLLLHSFIPGREYQRLKNQLKAEFKCQIDRVLSSPICDKVRLDSHQHTHMIPIVFDAMMEAVGELNLMDRLEYIRITREPIMMFFTTKGMLKTIPFSNLLKNLILNLLSIRVVRKLRPYSLDKAMVWGMMRSGMIDTSHYNAMKNRMVEYATRKNRYLELVTHPGNVSDSSEFTNCNKDDRLFWKSEYRPKEYSMLMER